MSDATIEVDGEVYELASSTMHDNTQTYTTGSGERYTMRLGAQSLDATTTDPRARALVRKGAVRCRVELYGATYTGYVELVRWSAGFASIDLRVHDLKPIPVAPTLDKSIGKFTAPGTGDVGVLGIELTHDFATGMKEGVVRLEKRPYWEGGATPFTLEMPATSERASMHLTGLWIARGDFDGEGCNVTITGVTMRSAAPAAPTLDETTNPADLDWGTIRSTCAARDWRAAWGVVGTDHTGDATPGEVYLLAVARRASATAAALHHWRELRERVVLFGKGNVSWQRIKRIAAWESSAAAQYVKPTKKAKRASAWVDALERNIISTPRMVGGPFGGSAMQAIIDDPVPDDFRQEYQGIPSPQIWADARADWARQARLYGRDNVSDDTLDTLAALRQLTRAAQAADTTVRPTHMWIDEATLDALRQRAEDDAVTRGNGGIVGVLNNPYLSAAAQRGEITGTVTIQPRASDMIPWQRPDTNARATWHVGIATHPTNPVPRGPQTRRRR